MSEIDKIKNMVYYGPSGKNLMSISSKFYAARNAVFPDGVPAYQEIGDTAFLTFDSFISDADDLSEGSPIKNVIVDLSNNASFYDKEALVEYLNGLK